METGKAGDGTLAPSANDWISGRSRGYIAVSVVTIRDSIRGSTTRSDFAALHGSQPIRVNLSYPRLSLSYLLFQTHQQEQTELTEEPFLHSPGSAAAATAISQGQS